MTDERMLTPGTARPGTPFRAPIANETERAHFQRRLAFSLLVIFVLAFGFWLVTVSAHPFLGRGSISVLFRGPLSTAQLATTFTALVGWGVLRARKWGVNFVDAVDVLCMVAICWGWGVMATSSNAARRPELVGILAISYTLVIRSAFVPSTTLRTGVIAAAGFLPLIPETFFMYTSDAATTIALDQAKVLPLGPAVYVAIWSAIGIACTSTISHVIYGLRLQVRRATQLGQYLLEHKVGEGGMGVVYRASHAMLRRPTAIKLLTTTTGHAAERFEREVQLTARLTHPNTIAVFDYGRTPDGVFYYAMEYLDGITLDELVRVHGPQSPARVVHVLVQICGALEEAHGAGLVHRDIKPANVMLTERGGQRDVVKVLDFGLVKESGADAAQLGTTSMNAVMGTPHYMAPEAILDPPSVDARTDLYALGVTAYYLLTGVRVFEGTNLVEICSAHLHQAPVRPSERSRGIPEALERVVLGCLEKKPADRPKDAADLSAQLLACKVPDWTKSDARAWWEQQKQSPKGPAKPLPRGDVTPLATVTVALEDRAAS
jgi:eukaryotic-like serine/threonine-protein kinase